MDELVKMISLAQERVQSIRASVNVLSANADQLLCEAKVRNGQELPESPEAIKQDIQNMLGILDEVNKSELFHLNASQLGGTGDNGKDFVSVIVR